MIIKGVNILSHTIQDAADAVCFTSNGVLTKSGRLVMGAGVALQFRKYYENIDLHAGKCVKQNGNICQVVLKVLRDRNRPDLYVIAFPTKEHWRDSSKIELIKRSAQQLVSLANNNNWKQVYVPAPGCGLGGLDFDKDVVPVLDNLLDDRFIVTYGIIK
jgi:O-acetyl-ADP-ribose deacetylase (regulator of RNase III)